MASQVRICLLFKYSSFMYYRIVFKWGEMIARSFSMQGSFYMHVQQNPYFVEHAKPYSFIDDTSH